MAYCHNRNMVKLLQIPLMRHVKQNPRNTQVTKRIIAKDFYLQLKSLICYVNSSAKQNLANMLYLFDYNKTSNNDKTLYNTLLR